MPLSLCILSPLQTRHRNQIDITIPSCCWQSWARTCGLFPLVPQSLYLETYLSQKEVCRANRHSAGHRDEGSAPSCPLWPPPSSHTGTGLPLSGLTSVCLLPVCRFWSRRTPNGLSSTLPDCSQSQGSDPSLFFTWEAAVGRDERADATFTFSLKGSKGVHWRPASLPSDLMRPSVCLALVCLKSSARQTKTMVLPRSYFLLFEVTMVLISFLMCLLFATPIS